VAALTESELPSAGRAMRWRLASDSALARAAANGAEGAFDEIFARYQPALVRHCRAILLDPDEAQDAAQNALTSALRALRRGTSDPVSLKAWLYRIAHNEAVAIAKRRSAQQAGRASDGEAALERIAVDGPADDDTRRRLADLVSDLRQLPDRQRNALLLRELSGLGYDEIAGVLGTSAGASRQTVFEARTALLDIGAGREESCERVRRLLSDGDGRMRRGRRVRAHVRTCAACTDFVAQIDGRSHDLHILFPLGPALAVLSGTAVAGAGAGGAAGAAGGAWGIGLGASAAVKCATVCAAAAIVGAAAMESPSVLLPGEPPAKHAPAVALSAPKHSSSKARPVALATVAERAPRQSATRAPKASTPRGGAYVSRRPEHVHRATTAHLPALPQHHAPPAQAPASPQAPASSTLAKQSSSGSSPGEQSRHGYTSFMPAVAAQAAQQAMAAAQQQSANIVQQAMQVAQTSVTQSLSLAQQMVQRMASSFLGRNTATRSANAPASTDTP